MNSAIPNIHIKRLFILLLFSFSILWSQTNEDEELIMDSTYIFSFKEQLIIKVFTNRKTNSILQEYSTNGSQLRFKPNDHFKIGFAFNYKWMGLGLSLFNPLKHVEQEKKGESTSFDIQSNIYLDRFGIDLFFQNYSGYYLENSKAFNYPNFLKRPDLRSAALGGDVFYIFNHKQFSYRAAFLQTAKQLKSAGSMIVGFKSGLYYTSADSSWAPANATDLLPDHLAANQIAAFNIGIGCGYAYTKVFDNHLFMTLSGFPSISIQGSNFVMNDPTKNRVQGNGFLKIQWKGAIGYNSKDHYFGMNFVNDRVNIGEYLQYKYYYRFGYLKFIAAKRF